VVSFFVSPFLPFINQSRFINFYLDVVEYKDWNSNRPKWKRLCSRLKRGMCEKKKSFKKGHHVVDIQVTDEAGNAISERIEFDV